MGRDALGEPFASGREADVYALDAGTVLRRYRGGGDASREAAVMAYAASLGYPVPRVFRADGPDLEMERLVGPTMAAAYLDGKLAPDAAAAIMADLLRRLHALPGRGGVGSVVHLDLHPDNILLTDRGPMVIDWCNAGDGDPDFDTALTALILAQVAIGSIGHEIGADAGAMLDRLMQLVPGDPIAQLDEVVAYRAGQSTMSADEVAALPIAAARVRRAGSDAADS
ncbi:phosphotransferase [Paractinoplanes hotanensis]|uniref:Phosphotransferase n=1 Tax=Paractinoplanes hotanensis TaxID=2906497 RepID=A0ABT0YCA5_9ACTN|nr:phosphotransferase [Actinoplanes hotanensis]MCM4083677.1 phosphotransferase [Actinoplanes hotanensis]